jgi:glucose/arabinose dehydrogenase
MAPRLVAVLCACSVSILPATLPGGFAETQLAAGLASPTAMAFAPDGRLFVCEQAGKLRVIKDGALLAAPFVTLSVDTSGERGLLGVTFDPGFALNQYVYLYYTTATSPQHNRVSRFTANGDVALPGSETVIWDVDTPGPGIAHQGGAIHFGPDGKLYVAVGEHGDAASSPDLSIQVGKILRINPDGSIPLDNPFYNVTTGGSRAIWARGLRNPFTFAFQPGAGRMFINDVGDETWEEINEGVAGADYGWPATEGPTTDPRYRSPIYAYRHGSASPAGCAIVGGAFYNPPVQQFPSSFLGRYFFADYCNRWIRVLDPATGLAEDFASNIITPVDVKVGPDGALYYAARWGGVVYRVHAIGSGPPQIGAHPLSVTVTAGRPASFSVSAFGTEPLSYQWQRDGVDIPGATSYSYTLASTALADSGAQFRCVVTNSLGSATSQAAVLTVTPNNPPAAAIVSPSADVLYTAGQTLSYSGSATDPEDGALAAGALTWQVDFHHEDHLHPFMQPATGAAGGSFLIPNIGETSANVWYRITLTARDSGGLTHTIYRDVYPRKSRIQLASSPPGLQLTLDSQPVTPPYTVESVVGMMRALGAPSPQTLNETPYEFASWSDGLAAGHTVATPAVDTTYTAAFRVVGANSPPAPVIGTPAAGTLYSAGQTISYSGTAADEQDGVLGGASFTWSVEQHRDGQVLTVVAPYSGTTGGSFTVPATGLAAGAFYRITLTVRDSAGAASSVFRDVLPRTVTLTLDTSPRGLQLTLDNQAVTTPHSFLSVVGMIRTLSAVSPQIVNGQFYEYASWSDGKAATHTVTTPSSNATYTATYRARTMGLSGRYYDKSNLSGPSVTRIDPVVDFDFGTASPAPGISPTTYSVRWTGYVWSLDGGVYTFYTQSNDGVWLWVNGQRIINNWTNHELTEDAGAISLQANRKYPLQLEYYNDTGTGTIRLYWSSPALAKQVLPAQRLTVQ